MSDGHCSYNSGGPTPHQRGQHRCNRHNNPHQGLNPWIHRRNPMIAQYLETSPYPRQKKLYWLASLGHTRVTHSYLLLGEEQPHCVVCDAPFTVRHFLLEYGNFAQVRSNNFHFDNMKRLFQDIHIDKNTTKRT